MKKYVLLFAIVFASASILAQTDTKVKVENKGDLTEATYYYENGEIQQQGTFNADGQLHGEWISYDIDGNKLAVGKYHNGEKVGKWFFWTDDSLTEVDYIDSKIATVNEWTDKTRVAVRNK